jgi:hypothetical protein
MRRDQHKAESSGRILQTASTLSAVFCYYTRTLSVSLSIAFSLPLPKSLAPLRDRFPLHQCPLLRPFRLASNSPPWALRRARSRYVCQAIHRCAGANWPTARRWSRLVRVHLNVTETTPVADISAL